MKPRLAFVGGMIVIALLLAPVLPWSSWKQRFSPHGSVGSVTPATATSSVDVVFAGDRTEPYLFTLQEESRATPVTWQVFVEPSTNQRTVGEGKISEGRVSGYLFTKDATFDVYGSVVTSTDQLVYTAYNGTGEQIASATTTWNKQVPVTDVRWVGERDRRQAQLEPLSSDLVRVSFMRVADRWEDQKRRMACEFGLTLPVVEPGGPVSAAAAEIMNRTLRDALLHGRSTPEQVKNTYIRECRTELEQEAEWWKSNDDPGGMFQRSSFMGVSIVRNRSPWLSLTIDSAMYSGGAHGLAGSDSLLFDVRTGRTIELQGLLRDEASLASFHGLVAEKLLSDYGDLLFEEQASQLRTYVADRSRQLERWRAGELGYSTSTVFSVTPSGVRVHFQQYEVAPYAVGMPTVDLPFSEWSSLASEEARRVFTAR